MARVVISRTNMTKLSALLSVLVLVACGGKKEPPAVAIDAAGANALVPADLKAKIVFEEKSVVEERGRKSKTVYTLAAPKTWTADDKMKMFAKVSPPHEDGYGNFTDLGLGSNCDGRCESKDWAKVSEKVDFAQFRTGYKIVKDEAKPTSHLIVATNEDTTYVSYAWWVDGGDHYFTCRAALQKSFMGDGPDPRAAAPAFEKACQAVNVKTVD